MKARGGAGCRVWAGLFPWRHGGWWVVARVTWIGGNSGGKKGKRVACRQFFFLFYLKGFDHISSFFFVLFWFWFAACASEVWFAVCVEINIF